MAILRWKMLIVGENNDLAIEISLDSRYLSASCFSKSEHVLFTSKNDTAKLCRI
jgi:hypothetical protein